MENTEENRENREKTDKTEKKKWWKTKPTRINITLTNPTLTQPTLTNITLTNTTMTKPTLTNPCDLYGICIVFIFYCYSLFCVSDLQQEEETSWFIHY